MDFADVVRSKFKEPLESLCEALMNAGEMEQHLFFSEIVDMSYEPGDEFSVITASIELSRCFSWGSSIRLLSRLRAIRSWIRRLRYPRR